MTERASIENVHRGSALYDMHAGDVAVVPRGTPHYFVNTGSAPAAAFAVFTPPYDGQDQVRVETPPLPAAPPSDTGGETPAP